MKKILILGGTQYVGRVFLEELEKSYPNADVTLFNRGKTNVDLFPNFKRIKGDRYSDDILKITNENWDIVIDFSCYHPSSLRTLLPHLINKVGRYIFISTVSVYDFPKAYEMGGEIDEDYPTASYDDSMEDSELLKFYGNKKAECERIILSHEKLDSIILRPSIIYGKYNIYDRIYYWIYRVKNHEQAILPDQGTTLRNHTFVNDFAQMILKSMIVKNHSKVYNATSFPPTPLLDIVNEIKGIAKSEIDLINIPREYLMEDDKLKEWIPMYSINSNNKFSNKKIINELGLDFHSIKDSFSETMEYYESIEKNDEGKHGLKINKEKAILFGYFLDKDLYDKTKKLLSDNCEYDIGNEILKGPAAICHSYESNMIEGKNKMDKLEWGQSRVEEISPNEFYVHFTDYLNHNNCDYTHRCKQKLTLDENHKIVRIEHIHNEDEQQKLNEFYRSVGILKS